MGTSRTHDNTSDQWTVCGEITDLETANFQVENGQLFNIDNENETAVVLSVKLARMETFVSKKFLPGPNPFLIKEIEANVVLTAPELALLKYGY